MGSRNWRRVKKDINETAFWCNTTGTNLQNHKYPSFQIFKILSESQKYYYYENFVFEKVLPQLSWFAKTLGYFFEFKKSSEKLPRKEF